VRKVLVVPYRRTDKAYRLPMISNDLRVERRVNRNTGVPYHGYIAFMLMVTHVCHKERESDTPAHMYKSNSRTRTRGGSAQL
jgi:hypothetical protein